MIRPEALAALRRWREVILATSLALIGLWLATGHGALLPGAGLVLIALAAAWALYPPARVAALALLLIFITGVLLVVAHPQPPAILFANPGYRTKLLMFFAMAISFGYPSRLFHHWRRSLRQGRAPLVSTQQQFWVIWILRGNLLLLALLPLLAKLASR